MGTTGSGLPYPEDTDPTSQGAQAIKALAQKLGPCAGGQISLVANNQASVTGSVTFPAGRFTAPPAVTVACNNASWVGFMGTPTATGTNLGMTSKNGAAGTYTGIVYWTAVGVG